MPIAFELRSAIDKDHEHSQTSKEMAFQRLNNSHSSPMVCELCPIVLLPSSQFWEATASQFLIIIPQSNYIYHIKMKKMCSLLQHVRDVILIVIAWTSKSCAVSEQLNALSSSGPTGSSLQRPPARPILQSSTTSKRRIYCSRTTVLPLS
jgi:hypothetical protein